MSKKGLSPVIATILLIVVVISLASIVFIWARGLIPAAIQKGGIPVEQACNSMALTAVYSSFDGVLTITNDGNIPVHKFVVSVTSGSEVTSQEITSPILAGDFYSEGFTFAGDSMTISASILGDANGDKKIYKCSNTFDVIIE